ncbi:MAG: beta-agarase [Verrucomicrobiota bacterium]
MNTKSPPNRPGKVSQSGRHSTWLGCLALLTSLLSVQAAGRPLVDITRDFDPKSVPCSDASMVVTNTPAGSALHINTGHTQTWPGVTLPATGGHWDLSAYASVGLHVKNTGTNTMTVYCRVDNPGADGTKHGVTASLVLSPGQTNLLKVKLRHESDSTMDGKLFGMRGYPVKAVAADTFDPKNVTQLVIFVSKPKEDHSFELTEINASGEHTRPTAWVTDAEPFFPFIDTFGQYKHKDWPGKVHSLAELQERRKAEGRELADRSGPSGRDQYGGWAKGPQKQATGFFRTEKVNGKWWLVDPEGRLFWSHGVDCVRMSDGTPIEERATWFENFPGEQDGFTEFLSTGFALKGHYAKRNVKSFSFAEANLKRKYGDQWRQDYPATVHQRLRNWGLNTIANWSDASIFLMHRTPYTDTIGSHGAKMIGGSKGYWGQFPDVFDASFARAMRRGMDSKTNSSANDPWCLGYFSDNEMSWGEDTSLALGVIQSAPEQAAKRELVNDLKVKYSDIASLNSVWGTSHTSWEALLESRTAPEKEKARQDLVAFGIKLAETYFRTVQEAIKAVAPHQLYLGCRFAWVNNEAAKAAGKYCDVVSYNLYRRSIADFQYPGGDKPLLVGEFHFGALDRGLFHTGLVAVENQQARAEAYRNYVIGALRHPQFVGTHWFQWKDEPTTGRVYDEENYQIGFVDVADTPYPETIAASREIGRRLYEVRSP